MGVKTGQKKAKTNCIFTWFGLSSTPKQTKAEIFKHSDLTTTEQDTTKCGFSWCYRNHCWLAIVWVMCIVFSIFCFTSFGESNTRNTKKLPKKMKIAFSIIFTCQECIRVDEKRFENSFLKISVFK